MYCGFEKSNMQHWVDSDFYYHIKTMPYASIVAINELRNFSNKTLVNERLVNCAP